MRRLCFPPRDGNNSEKGNGKSGMLYLYAAKLPAALEKGLADARRVPHQQNETLADRVHRQVENRAAARSTRHYQPAPEGSPFFPNTNQLISTYTSIGAGLTQSPRMTIAHHPIESLLVRTQGDILPHRCFSHSILPIHSSVPIAQPHMPFTYRPSEVTPNPGCEAPNQPYNVLARNFPFDYRYFGYCGFDR